MAGEAILIVDDNPVYLKLIRVLLTAKGYDIRTATDAEEALAVLGTFRPRLILMDVQLPGMTGLELTQRLKSDPTTRNLIIVALTAYAMKGDEEKALHAAMGLSPSRSTLKPCRASWQGTWRERSSLPSR